MGYHQMYFVVDLDNSLIRSDLLYESFFAGLARQPLAVMAALMTLREGRAALKAALARLATLDPSILPYDETVLRAIHDARRQGQRTALVSAADQRLVEAVAAHLGCFDEAHGSDGVRNLKGENKAAFLVERFGERNFDYVGDAPVDLAIWSRARRVITVGIAPKLKRRVELVSPDALHIAPRTVGLRRWTAYVEALRPHQWLKNVLVFLPVLAAHAASGEAWAAAVAAFLAFSLTASSVYILNDLLDLAADRAHPRKRTRPFASGRVPIADGMVMAACLLALAVAVAALAAPIAFLGILALYYVVTFAYSFVLKRRLVIDICTLAGLYTIRVVAGAAAADLPLSPWMLAFSGFLFLSLAAMKRQAELVDALRNRKERAVGRAYEVDDLPVVAMMAIASGYIAVLVLALYLNSPAVEVLYSSPPLLWGICPVLLFWVSRLSIYAHRGAMHDDPLVFAMRDRISIACGVLVFCVAAAGTFL